MALNIPKHCPTTHPIPEIHLAAKANPLPTTKTTPQTQSRHHTKSQATKPNAIPFVDPHQ
jgi:hypothetical protein